MCVYHVNCVCVYMHTHIHNYMPNDSMISCFPISCMAHLFLKTPSVHTFPSLLASCIFYFIDLVIPFFLAAAKSSYSAP